MDDSACLAAIYGYLNFSNGTHSPKFAAALNEFLRNRITETNTEPWLRLGEELIQREIQTVNGAEPPTSENQAPVVIRLVFQKLLPAYREHHRDLLFHRSDAELFQPFFLVRAFEAVLAQQGPWTETDRIIRGALVKLNDFLGHRPIAVLENGRKCQPYDHERTRPVPIFFRNVGPAIGKYEELVRRAIQLLADSSSDTLFEASFDLELMDELAIDARAYDFGHPVNSRPGYIFGEWDPHHFDTQGRYRRFVIRWLVLDALIEWLDISDGDPETAWMESSAVLAGTMLLASGVSGGRVDEHDSEITLAKLVSKVAHCRDGFYHRLLGSLKPEVVKYLKADAEKTKQPFGGIRQYLNQHLGQYRAAQLQADNLAQVFAKMGYAEAAREQAWRIPSPAIRVRCEIQNHLISGHRSLENANVSEAAAALPTIEDLLHRGIGCGAIVDPWNILAFAGQYSLFPAAENSMPDERVDQLLDIMRGIFNLCGRVLREAAAAGEKTIGQKVSQQMFHLADWWDQFASVEVSDIERVSGDELAQSASFVAKALAEWRESGAASGDVKFWRGYGEEFTSPRAFASVLEALLQQGDLVASMSLFMHWLSQSEMVPLEAADASFHELALQWMETAMSRLALGKVPKDKSSVADLAPIVPRFFELLELNSDELWSIPSLGDNKTKARPSKESDELFSSAYEGVTFRDSAQDGNDGSVADNSARTPRADELTELSESLRQRLTFLSTIAKLWQLAGNADPSIAGESGWQSALGQWAEQAINRHRDLGRFITEISHYHIDRPSGAQEAIMEYDRLQAMREEIVARGINTRIEFCHAARILLSAQTDRIQIEDLEPWEVEAIEIRRAIRAGNVKGVQNRLRLLLMRIRSLPLVFVPLDRGGNPQEIFHAKYLRDLLKRVVHELPRLGLFRETYHVLATAVEMENNSIGGERQVSEFNLLYPVGYSAVLEHLVAAIRIWDETKDDPQEAATIVKKVIARFSKLWIDHISGVRLSELERRSVAEEWQGTVRFIQNYGRDIFTQKFMTLANLRGILHQGVESFLDSLLEDPHEGVASVLLSDIDRNIKRSEAIRQLDFVLRCVFENYDVYREYNTTTTQSDYGDNLYMLLEFLRLQARYDRHRWALQPLYWAHEILARRGQLEVAALVEQALADETATVSDTFLTKLKKTEKKHSMRLAIISDHLSERFTKQLRLDRALALVDPSMRDARQMMKSDEFSKLQQHLHEFTESATGAGMDVPLWVRRLDAEVGRVAKILANKSPSDEQINPPPITLSDFDRQYEAWDEPFGGPPAIEMK